MAELERSGVHKSYPEIETSRLRLRQFCEQDCETFVPIYGDAAGMQFMGKGAKSPAETAQSIKWKMLHWDQRGYGLWCVVEKSTGAVIGHCGLAWLDFLEEVEVAYLIDRSRWGRGYATEAVCASIDFGFDCLNPERMVAIVRPGNIASERVATKNGMTFYKSVLNNGFEFNCFQIERKVFRVEGKKRSESYIKL